MTSDQIEHSIYFMRKTPSQSRSIATVDAILSAAAQVLIHIGYRNVSTNKIAERAGVGIGSLYEYFPGKEAIFAEVRRREDKKLFDLIMNHPVPDTVRDLVREHIALHIDLVRSNLTLYRALYSEVPHFAIVEEELPRYKHYVPWAEKFFRVHQDEIRQFDNLTTTTHFIIHTGQAVVADYVLNSPESLQSDELENQIVNLIERYLLKS